MNGVAPEARGRVASEARGRVASEARGQVASEARGQVASEAGGQVAPEVGGQVAPEARGRGASGAVVLLGGGGTGGHVFPAVAVAKALASGQPPLQPIFVGVPQRLEGRLVPEAGFELVPIDAPPVPRRPSPQILRVPFALRRAVQRCVAAARETEAVAAVTFGGYVSFPLARAAHRLDLPLVIHEQNSVPGLANRLAARWADAIAVTFPGSGELFPHSERVVVTGDPVREEILRLDEAAARERALTHFDLDPDRRTLLVFGGSQGAASLNRAAVDSFALWPSPERLQILHAAGRDRYRDAAAGWERVTGRRSDPIVRCVDFIEDMGSAYAVADLVVCRAGATSIAELTVLGKPAILVPYPYATGDHQRHNAMALERTGAARMLPDEALTGSTLVAAAAPILDDDDVRAGMRSAARAFARPDAAHNVARLVRRLVDAHLDTGGGQ